MGQRLVLYTLLVECTGGEDREEGVCAVLASFIHYLPPFVAFFSPTTLPSFGSIIMLRSSFATSVFLK